MWPQTKVPTDESCQVQSASCLQWQPPHGSWMQLPWLRQFTCQSSTSCRHVGCAQANPFNHATSSTIIKDLDPTSNLPSRPTRRVAILAAFASCLPASDHRYLNTPICHTHSAASPDSDALDCRRATDRPSTPSPPPSQVRRPRTLPAKMASKPARNRVRSSLAVYPTARL
jgi:hypothetical protein